MDFMISRGIGAAEYVGIEAVDELVAAAMRKRLAKAEIVHGDFVSHPQRLKIGADVVVFSGSLNTLEREQFYLSLKQGFGAAGEVIPDQEVIGLEPFALVLGHIFELEVAHRLA